ncbi:MAG: helix-turn-helix domain-containing protein [Planctomycetes bacterium]|nr:helix-turn-helix domain-containing protein [Planctomycetota bacterium]
MSVKSQIGGEIKRLRERLSLSSKDLAERVGLSPSQMSRLESGQRRVDATLLGKLARALEVHPSHFFSDFGEVGGAGGRRGGWPTPLGKLIRSERRRKHITAEELAQQVSKGKTFLQDLESGKTDLVTGDTLLRLAKNLKLTPEQLLDAQRAEIRELRAALREAESGDGRGVPLLEAPDGGLPHALGEDRALVGEELERVLVPGVRGRAFAVSWRNDEMTAPSGPSFPPGSTLVFSYERPARHEDFVFALVDGGGTFRRLFMDPNGLRLQPLNLNYPPRSLAREDVLALYPLVASVVHP